MFSLGKMGQHLRHRIMADVHTHVGSNTTKSLAYRTHRKNPSCYSSFCRGAELALQPPQSAETQQREQDVGEMPPELARMEKPHNLPGRKPSASWAQEGNPNHDNVASDSRRCFLIADAPEEKPQLSFHTPFPRFAKTAPEFSGGGKSKTLWASLQAANLRIITEPFRN